MCIFESHTFIPVSWMYTKQTSFWHRSTESELISLDAGLRLDELVVLDLWDMLIEALRSTDNKVEPKTFKWPWNCGSPDSKTKTQHVKRKLSSLCEVSSVTLHDAFFSRWISVAHLWIRRCRLKWKGKDEDIQNPQSCTWLFDRINLGRRSKIENVDTKKLADILTKLNFHTWWMESLLVFVQYSRSDTRKLDARWFRIGSRKFSIESTREGSSSRQETGAEESNPKSEASKQKDSCCMFRVWKHALHKQSIRGWDLPHFGEVGNVRNQRNISMDACKTKVLTWRLFLTSSIISWLRNILKKFWMWNVWTIHHRHGMEAADIGPWSSDLVGEVESVYLRFKMTTEDEEVQRWDTCPEPTNFAGVRNDARGCKCAVHNEWFVMIWRYPTWAQDVCVWSVVSTASGCGVTNCATTFTWVQQAPLLASRGCVRFARRPSLHRKLSRI